MIIVEMKGRRSILPVIHVSALLVIGTLFSQCEGNRTVQRSTTLAQETVPADSTENDLTFDTAWADSISAITGIGYGPYFYDPSWSLAYSESGKTLLYYPRDSAATHFSIPETVQVIDERAFQCNKHLVEIFIPKNVQEIGVCSFYGCEELREVTIEGPVTSIPWRAFDGCQKLRTVDLPAFVQSIGGLSFASCGSLRTFIVRNPEPPHFEFEDDPEDFETMGAFFDTDLHRCTLFVPEGSVEAYRQAPGWKLFKQIQMI